MSLEDALKENTEVMRQLIAALSAGTVNREDARVPGHPAETAKVETSKTEKSKGDAPTLNYDDHVKRPFLQLLNTKREAAMKLLADLGVSNLKGFENQPEKFAELSQKIQEAQNG